MQPSAAVLGQWNEIGRKLIAIAEDLPKNKYDYKPTPQSCSFVQELVHTSGSMYYFTDVAFHQRRAISWFSVLLVVGTLVISEFHTVLASDHLDTSTVIADPAVDIGDIFAWTSSDGKCLNMVMDIVAHQFSDRLQYVFHVDSGN